MKKINMLLYAIIVIISLVSCKATQQIGGPVAAGQLKDGIYDGYFKAGPNSAEVKVTIKDQKITDIQIVKHDCWKGKKAEPVIPQRIIEQQSTRVDAVSGATNSSNVIMNAVQNAVEKAKKSNS